MPISSDEQALAAALRLLVLAADRLRLDDVALHLNTALILLDGEGVPPPGIEDAV